MAQALSVVSLLLVILVCVNAQQSCPIPPKFKTNYDFKWQSKSNEWMNNVTKPALISLVLSWTPTFCESLSDDARSREFQCQNMDHFGLVVHGLWPQVYRPTSVQDHPRNCRDDSQLNTTFVKRYFCLMPDEDLIQSQWEKHGSCFYRTAAEYYGTIEKLYRSLKIPNLHLIKTATVSNVKQAFISENPFLFTSALYVVVDSSSRLKEVRVCYNLKHEITNCT